MDAVSVPAGGLTGPSVGAPAVELTIAPRDQTGLPQGSLPNGAIAIVITEHSHRFDRILDEVHEPSPWIANGVRSIMLRPAPLTASTVVPHTHVHADPWVGLEASSRRNRLRSKPERGILNGQTDLIDQSHEPVLRISAAVMITPPGQ